MPPFAAVLCAVAVLGTMPVFGACWWAELGAVVLLLL
jgi:hypothetical protein